MSSSLPALITFVFAAAITPGPTNAVVSASGVNFGYRRSIPLILGSMAALPSLIVAIGLGLGQLLQAYGEVHLLLKVSGSAYLVYLAWKIATAARPQSGSHGGRPFTFIEAALFQWLNPKGWLVGSSALAAFSRGPESYLSDTLGVAAIFLVMIFIATSTWCLFGAAIGRRLRSKRALTAFNLSMGLLIIASIGLLYI